MHYQWITPTHRNRTSVETFICDRYWLNFNACLSHLPETLLGLYENGTLVAACGIQFAEQKPLFSQWYLDKPLQQYLVGNKHLPAAECIAEVGSMAAIRPNYLPLLFKAVVESLLLLGRTAVVFTATRALQKYFAREGIALTLLAEAKRAALPDSIQDIWGNYYQHQPLVLSGWLSQGQILFNKQPWRLTQESTAEVASCR
ncbi:thermostable hemolysin [Idiomarina sp. HP20-50]|uniref:thermostable hemolysin n=1 Tax=Idiomarina sp. HP20-50 TaxID=3070813 RepID=UPI00294B223F|nr:thermostable hemolysin [Idiomarina sp. HP20-50]MDV6316428.1 thermostable hemolysin [Idiomarina sp. HP20-50]